jgi:hypothetical protein
MRSAAVHSLREMVRERAVSGGKARTSSRRKRRTSHRTQTRLRDFAARRRDTLTYGIEMVKGSLEGERGIARDELSGEVRHGDKTARQSTFKCKQRRRPKTSMPIGDKASSR